MSAVASFHGTGVAFDPMLNKSYRHTRLGGDVVDWLAWCDLGGLAPRTLEDYERYLARVCTMFPDVPLREMTDAQIGHVIRSWPQASRRTRKAAIDSFFKWAIQTRRLETNPMQYLPRIKRTSRVFTDVFTAAEVEALCGLPAPDGVLMMILLDGGLRKAEARCLQAKHAQPEQGAKGQIVVIAGKGGKDRVIGMTGRLRAALADLYLMEGMGRDAFLWYDNPGGHAGNRRRTQAVGNSSFKRWWDTCIESAGVRYRKPHATRHTFATSWRRRGLALDEIQKLLGHSSITTTEALYTHTTMDDVAGRMAAIEHAEAQR